MFEAYAIGVTLKLNNLVSAQLLTIASEVRKLDGLVSSLGASLKLAGAESAGLKKIAKDGAASSVALDKASRSAADFERRLAAIRVTASSIPAMPLMPTGGRGPGTVVPGGGGAAGGGGGRRGGWHGGNIHMGPGGVGIGTVGVAAGDAFVPLAITAGALYGGHALYESAKDLDTEKHRFKLFGMTAAQNKEAFDYVAGLRLYGTSQAQNLKNMREAQAVFRESGESGPEALAGAKLAAPIMAKIQFATAALDEEAQARMRSSSMAMLRYIEMTGGAKDPRRFAQIADFGWKLNQSSGGQVDWEQLRQLKNTAGTAGYRLTEDALARLEPVLGELKGGGVGTALATSFNRLEGITKLPNQTAHMLVQSGLWDKNKVEFNSQGGIRKFNGSPLSAENSKLFQENPELFYEKVIRPIYAKMNLSQEEIARDNAAIFGRTGGKLFNAIENQLSVIHKSVEAIERMKGINESVAEAKQSLSGQEQEFSAAWTDFKAAFGTSMLPFFTGILKGGTSILRAIPNTGVVSGPASGSIGGPFGPVLDALSYPARLLFGAARGSLGVNPVAGPSSQPTTLTANLHIDGAPVAKAVTKLQAAKAFKPQAGASFFDTSMSPMPTGLGVSYGSGQ